MFFDLHKAADSVPNLPLLPKLSDCALNRYVLKWISCYSPGRKEYVVMDGGSSECIPAILSVPQGSVVGPLCTLTLYVLLVNLATSIPSFRALESASVHS